MSNLPSEAVTMMRQEVLHDPTLIKEAAHNAQLATAADIEAQRKTLADAVTAQNQLIAQMGQQIADLQYALTHLPDATTTAKGVTWFAGDGAATAGRAVQATDARLSDARPPKPHAASHAAGGGDALPLASAATAGLMSAPDKTKLDGLGKTTLAVGTATIPAIALNGSANVTVTFTKPLPAAPSNLTYSIWGVTIGSLTVTEVSKSATGAILKLQTTSLVAISAGGTLQVIAYLEAI